MAITNLSGHSSRGHPFRWLIVYASVVWVALQVVDIITESFGGSAFLMQTLILCAAAGVPLVLAGALYFSKRNSRQTEKQAPLAPALVAPSNSGILYLAVSPFECRSEIALDTQHCSAITEDIIALISRNPRYCVAVLSSADLEPTENSSIHDTTEPQNARYILEGSLRRTKTGFLVSARLVDAFSGVHLWSEKYNHHPLEFYSVLDTLCEKIVMQIDTQLTRQETSYAEQNPTAQHTAQSVYQQARGKLEFSGWNVETFAATESLLRGALEIDPNYAPAHAYLALVLALAHWTSLCADEETNYVTAMAEANRAIELGPESSEALGLAGCALSDLGHPDRGIPIIERSIELNPANAQAHAALGTANIMSGNISLGIKQLENAVSTNPSHPGLAPWSSVLSITFSSIGNPTKGLEWGTRAIKSDPRYFVAHLALALAWTDLQQQKRACQCLAEAVRLAPALSATTIEKIIGRNNCARLTSAGKSST